MCNNKLIYHLYPICSSVFAVQTVQNAVKYYFCERIEKEDYAMSCKVGFDLVTNSSSSANTKSNKVLKK